MISVNGLVRIQTGLPSSYKKHQTQRPDASYFYLNVIIKAERVPVQILYLKYCRSCYR